jgi:hypothetical protein
VTEFFDFCRYANVILGPVAFGALCYRAVVGIVQDKIIYYPLFLIFVYYVLLSALGAPTGIVVGRSATYLSPLATVAHVALIAACVFYPGPLTKARNGFTIHE